MADRQALYLLAVLAPGNKISGGKVLSSRTRRSSSRAAALLRLAATTIGGAIRPSERSIDGCLLVPERRRRDGDRPQDRSPVLQYRPARHDLQGSGC